MWLTRLKIFILVLVLAGEVIFLPDLLKPVIKADVNPAVHYSAIDWLNAFAGKDYGLCNSMVSDSSDMVVPETDLEDYTYQALSSSIRSINVLSVSEVDGVKTYDIEVTYTGFNPIDKLEFNTGALNGLKKRYLERTITDEEFLSGVEHELKESFVKNCFSSTTDSTFNTKITESSEGVSGCSDIVDTLYKLSGAENNISYYESEAKQELLDLVTGGS